MCSKMLKFLLYNKSKQYVIASTEFCGSLNGRLFMKHNARDIMIIVYT